MGMIEDALRDTFEAQSAHPPVLDDVAGRAIRGAGRTRRRRMTVLTTMAVIALVAGGLVALPDRRYPNGTNHPDSIDIAAALPSVVPTAGYDVMEPIPADLLNRNRLQMTDGRVFMLDGMGTVAGVWRVRDGWLAMSVESSSSSVWFIQPSGERRLLATGERAIVSHGTQARPGPQITWSHDGQLSLATLDGDHLTGTATTDGIGRLAPVAVVGDGVLLGGTGSSGSTDLWDMWFPERGPYKPTPIYRDRLSKVLGVTDDRIVGLVDGCLALLDPVEFRLDRQNCQLHFGSDASVYPSPGGNWWLVTTLDGVVLYDPVQIWVSAVPARQFVEHVLSATWLDRTSLLMTTDVELIRAFTNDPSTLPVIALPAQRQGIKVVPDLRAWS
jgi:hypothetical protein